MTLPKENASSLYYLLIGTLLVQGLSGVGGGVMLVADPTGALIGMPRGLLSDSPFGNFLLPGVILLLILGIIPLFVTWGLWKRRSWAWYGSVFVGLSLVIWIGVQIAMIGYGADPPLQAIYGGLGVAVLVLCLSRPVRAHLAAP